MPPGPTSRIDAVLHERFGLSGFRPMQREAVEAVLAGRDTLVVMPTGGGKSLCYQLPAVLLPGITLVVSPLIALMKDQADRLERLGIPATALNSTLSYAQTRGLVRRAQHGGTKVIFAAPERLESSPFREELASLDISLVAIDEAHCVSEWGHDFRTSYRRLPDIYSAFSGLRRPPIIALTATATPEVRADIIETLGMQGALEIVTGFDRPNLAYGVLTECDKPARLRDILRTSIGWRDATTPGSVIVYAATRRSVDAATSMLRDHGEQAEAYHAGLPLEERRRVQDRYQSGATRVIVATSAFGMGIDKPDVRTVIHYDIPGSLEAYYQEAGRAGRDGAPAHAILFFSANDVGTQQFLLRANSPAESEVRMVYHILHELARNAVGSVSQEVMMVPATLIAERVPRSGASIERMLEILEHSGHLRIDRSLLSDARARVQFLATRQRMDEIHFKSASKTLKRTIDALLRTVDREAYEREVALDVAALLQKFGIDPADFRLSIRTLEGLGLLRFTEPARGVSGQVFAVQLLTERLEAQHIEFGARMIAKRFEANVEKLERMVRYAAEWSCRRDAILTYFGERPKKMKCGICDVCVAGQRER